MIDATGWAERLKLAMYARMEELSFRSAVTTAAGVLAVTGLGVTLTVTSGGGQQEVTTPLGSAVVGAAPSASPSSSPALLPPSAEPSPSVLPVSASPQARHSPARQASSLATATAQPPSLLSTPAATYTAPSPRSPRSRIRPSEARLAPRSISRSARTGRTAMWWPALQQRAAVLRGRRLGRPASPVIRYAA